MHMCSKFPPDVLHDENVMELLTLCAKRIEHMQVQYWYSQHCLIIIINIVT